MKKTVRCFRILSCFFFFLYANAAFSETPLTGTEWNGNMQDLTPEFREHLQTVLQVIAKTEDGQFLLQHVSRQLEFRTRPMVQLGTADTRNVITLEQLRLENSAIPDTSAAHDKVKVCFTAEILAHELLHNAQMQAGLFQYPEGFSGAEAVRAEMLLELQAKYTGEKMFYNLCQQPEFRDHVPPKSGLFLVMQRQSKDSEKEYLETLWGNFATGSGGTKLYREQIREIRQWNLYYAEQGFRNNYFRFRNNSAEKASAAAVSYFQRSIDFLHLKIQAETLLNTSPVQAIPHGVAVFEDGKKVLELEAVESGYIRRRFQGTIPREEKVSFNR